MNKVAKSVLWVFLLTVLLLGIPRLAGLIANSFDYRAIDPDGAYAWLSVHHIGQALIFMALILVVNRFKPLNYGLGWGNTKVGQRYVLRFSLFFSIYLVGSFLTAILTHSLQPFAFPMTATNIVGHMGFQLFLSGPSEELIFRAFAITMLALVIKGRAFAGKISLPNLMAAVIFGLAHVGLSLSPFKVSLSIFQIGYAIVLGLFYGDCYEKSGGVIFPMMMHSISNVMVVGATIIATALMG